MTAAGSVLLYWKWSEHSKKIHEHKFFLLPPGPSYDRFDVIIGARYLEQHKHVIKNPASFLPLTSHSKLSPGQFMLLLLHRHDAKSNIHSAEQAQMAQAEENQRQEKEAQKEAHERWLTAQRSQQQQRSQLVRPQDQQPLRR